MQADIPPAVCLSKPTTTNHQPSGPSSVPSMNAESSKRVPVKISTKRVIFKRVTVSVTVAREKHLNLCKHLRRGKDGHRIGERHPASSGQGKKEQLWTEEAMDKAFRLWGENKNKPKHE